MPIDPYLTKQGPYAIEEKPRTYNIRKDHFPAWLVMALVFVTLFFTCLAAYVVFQ